MLFYRKHILLILVALFSFMVAWERTFSLGGLLSPNALIVLVLIGLGALWFLVGGRARVKNFPVFFLICFVGWVYMSTHWSLFPGVSRSEFYAWAGILFLVILLASIPKSEKDLDFITSAFIGSGLIVAALVLTTIVAEIGMGAVAGRRIIVGDQNPNWLAAAVAAILPIAFVKSVVVQKNRKLHIAIFFVLLFAVLMSGSRASALAGLFAVGLASFVLHFQGVRVERRRNRRMVLFLVLGLLAALAALFAFGLGMGRFERLVLLFAEFSDDKLTGRAVIFPIYSQAILDNPIFGYGAGVRYGAVPIDLSPHNAYLSIGFGMGAVGVFLFLFHLLSAVWMAFRAGRRYRYAIGYGAGILAAMIVFMTTANELNKFVPLLVGLAIASCGIVRRRGCG